MKTMKILLHLEITYCSIKTFFNTFIQMSSLKFTAPLKGEVSTSKAPFTSFLKLTKIRSKWNNWKKTLKIMKIFEQKPVKIDDFNEAEEKEVKEHVQKRKRKKKGSC